VATCASENWPAAEAALRKCLEYKADCDSNPPLAVNAWTFLHVASVGRHHLPEALNIYDSAAKILETRKRERDGLGLAVTHAMLAQLHQRGGNMQQALAEANEGLRTLGRDANRAPLRAMLCSSKAYSEVSLGLRGPGLAAAQQAVELTRSDQICPSQRNIAWSRLGDLGWNLWRTGESIRAIEILKEVITRLEEGSAETSAARHRRNLARVFREMGGTDEALYWLSFKANFPNSITRLLLAERAQIELASERFHDAARSCSALFELWRVETGATPEIASAEGLLANAFLHLGEHEKAAELAEGSLVVLTEWGHSDAARCRITIALARWSSRQEWPTDQLAHAVTQIENDPLLTSAEKCRFFEQEAHRLIRLGRAGDAEGLLSRSGTRVQALETLTPSPTIA